MNVGGESIHFDQDWKQLPYFISSRETAFEMSMINQFDFYWGKSLIAKEQI